MTTGAATDHYDMSSLDAVVPGEPLREYLSKIRPGRLRRAGVWARGERAT